MIAEVLAETGVLPVVVLDDADRAGPLGAALLAGGLRAVEVTFRTAAAEAAIRTLAKEPELLVGAGTVVNPGQVDRAVEAGARFVVSPGFSPAVAGRCAQRGVPLFPGVATGTEIMMALDAGLETVKFFPAERLGGVAMVSALSAPFPSVRFVPTGGIDAANLADYLSIPAVLAVGGTWMVARPLLREGRWDEISALAAAAVRAGGRAG